MYSSSETYLHESLSRYQQNKSLKLTQHAPLPQSLATSPRQGKSYHAWRVGPRCRIHLWTSLVCEEQHTQRDQTFISSNLARSFFKLVDKSLGLLFGFGH